MLFLIRFIRLNTVRVETVQLEADNEDDALTLFHAQDCEACRVLDIKLDV